MILTGIPTCDTCRKARRALVEGGHGVAFRDLRAEPLSRGEWAALAGEFGDALVNRSSATWRGLGEAERQADTATLLAAHPTLMKRPLIEDGGTRTLGWSREVQARYLK